jgi:hypothetical protein
MSDKPECRIIGAQLYCDKGSNARMMNYELRPSFNLLNGFRLYMYISDLH